MLKLLLGWCLISLLLAWAWSRFKRNTGGGRRMTYYIECWRCEGTGDGGTCPACGGVGYIARQGVSDEPQASRRRRVNWFDVVLIGAALVWLVIAVAGR